MKRAVAACQKLLQSELGFNLVERYRSASVVEGLLDVDPNLGVLLVLLLGKALPRIFAKTFMRAWESGYTTMSPTECSRRKRNATNAAL